MAENEAANCKLNCAVGIKEFKQSPETAKLEDRLEQDDVKQRIHENLEDYLNPGKSRPKTTKKQRRNIYVVGQDVARESIVEVEFVKKMSCEETTKNLYLQKSPIDLDGMYFTKRQGFFTNNLKIVMSSSKSRIPRDKVSV